MEKEKTFKNLDAQVMEVEQWILTNSGRSPEEVVVSALAKCGDNEEMAATRLVEEKIVQQTADVPDPRVVAMAMIEKYALKL